MWDSHHTHRHIFEEKIAPFILNVEEEAEDEGEVHDADEHHHHHARVYGHPVSDGALGAGGLVPHLANNNKNHMYIFQNSPCANMLIVLCYKN